MTERAARVEGAHRCPAPADQGRLFLDETSTFNLTGVPAVTFRRRVISMLVFEPEAPGFVSDGGGWN